MTHRTFEIGIDGERVIRGRIVTPADGHGPWPFAVIAYGHSSFLDWGFYPELSRRLAAAGIASVRFNYSGDGLGTDLRTFENEEIFARTNYGQELDDLALVRAHAAHQPDLDDDRAAVLGHSRGGGMALVHAAEDGRYRGVVTWAAIDAILRFSPQRLEAWRRDGEIRVQHWTAGRRVRKDLSVLRDAEQNRARYDIQAACGRLRCPVLVVQGTADASVPVEAAHRLVAACGSGRAALLEIAAADHVFGARHPLQEIPPQLERLLSTTVRWLRERLEPS